MRYDMAAVPLLYDIGIIRAVVTLTGPDRLFFGSDFPLLLYPSFKREADMALYVDQVRREAGLQPDEFEKIMGGNFLRFTEKSI